MEFLATRHSSFFFLFVLQEIEFMYKPGNLSAPPPVVTPHQPRLDWQMWFAALGSHTQAPWFTSLMYRLLQGKQDGMLNTHLFYLLLFHHS